MGDAQQLKIKAAFKFMTLPGKRHWCKSQKARRIVGLKSQEKAKSAFSDLGSAVSAGRWGRLRLSWQNILMLFSVQQPPFAWAGDECKSPALLHQAVSQTREVLAVAARLHCAAGTAAIQQKGFSMHQCTKQLTE